VPDDGSWQQTNEKYQECSLGMAGCTGVKTCVLYMASPKANCNHGICRPCVVREITRRSWLLHPADQLMRCPWGCGVTTFPHFMDLGVYCHEVMFAGGAGEYRVTETSQGAGPSSA
jgi:hypothetical protein